ncbi:MULTISPECIES: prenyltransferase/squalene oxidase repeat-containing protein [unclassified Streptomyces]|uniref:prenyltransferase/squalene oxidase repeat-containing protein n=1 Tax=unclassified Streptomyces TaxID=2593676 RepID=UPI00225BF2AB|nr:MULTISPECIES: prenyltransferase/squalene oxidase repeat-containing protein [unclassified Streptomyces]MCX4529398.1 peptidase [Streptomyces sp. NBC_01551]MCX4540062.1 peptidase [Streptomyces sp. NBC_01565]
MGTTEQAEQRIGSKGLLSLVSAALLTFAASVAFVSGTTPAAADPIGGCTATTGAIVAVDFGPFGGKVERGCDTTPTTGYELLHAGGFTTEGTVHDGPAFICRIGNGSFNSGTPYPTPDKEDCVLTPQATAYWSYWIASPGQKNWTYSPLGAMSRTPKDGDVDAWVFGGTDIGGTSGKPTFSPDEVRAGGGTPSPDPGGPKPPDVPPGAVNLPAATRWLTGKLTDGERVVNEGETTPNHLFTTEVVYALAALDRESPVARKAAAFLATPAQTEAYAYPAGKDQAPDATAAARLALVAEATGKDPRAFGGRNLLRDLVKYVCPSGADAPEPVPGCAAKGDFRSTGQTEGQAMAVIALLNGGVTPPADAVNRLALLQCDDGGFPSSLLAPGATCESEAGTTALVALALKRAGGHDAVVQAARTSLKKAQLPTGAWPAVSYSTAGSAYATGWAAQALRALGDPGHADAGVSWLSRQQLPEGAFPFEEGSTDPLLFATTPAVVGGAKSDLVTLTKKPEPKPEPSETKPTGPKPTDPKPTGPSPSLPPGEGPDLKKATAYLTHPSRLIRGRYYESATDFADYGMTIDGAYALAATGTDNAALRNVVDFLDKGGKDGKNRGLHDWTLVGTKYASGGSIGKAAVLAETVGRNPRDFGGRDLIAALAEGTCAAKTTTRQQCAAKGNYTYATSVFKQSLGVMAQVRAGETAAAAEPVAYLKSLQTPSGGWVSLIGEPSDPEVDSTAMAAMTVDLLPDADSQAAVDKALVWLAAQQKEDGGFQGASGNSVNSAALAIQGLSLDAPKYGAQIAKARTFLASQQNADGGFNVTKGGQPGSDVRASTQALGGATGISFGTLTRSLTGTTPQPVPSSSASKPVIVTPGDASGGDGGAGGKLASTGLQAAGLAGAAAGIVLAGWLVVTAARRRTRAGGGR